MKKGGIVWLSAFALIGLTVVLSGRTCLASYQFLDGKVYMTGWAENLSSVRLENGYKAPTTGDQYEKGELQTFRNTLQIETTVKFSPNLEFFAIGRGYYDASWDLDSGLPNMAEDEDAINRGDSMEADADLREWYITMRMKRLTCKIGRQQVIWGESDALRMADIINPLDTSWHWTFEDWENIRIPLRMVNLIYEPYTQSQFRFQLVWIPEDFRTFTWAPEGAPWAIPDVPQIFWDEQKDQLPDRHKLTNGEVGGRIQMTLNGWEFSLFDFYSRVDNFVYSCL